jgi:hypothetical protein
MIFNGLHAIISEKTELVIISNLLFTTIQSPDAIQLELLTASLNKLQDGGGGMNTKLN